VDLVYQLQRRDADSTGHVFEVTYNPAAGTATWIDRSFDLNDIPINDVARDEMTGDLYAASDFGVFRLRAGTSSWGRAAPGMPNVEVAGLTIRFRRAQAVRGDARAKRLAAEPAVSRRRCERNERCFGSSRSPDRFSQGNATTERSLTYARSR
jgi:hypothetical protein